jgi:hypothetical protein
LDVEDQFRRLAEAGFEPRALDRYPGFLAVARDSFVVLLQPTPDGLILFTSIGRLIESEIGLLIERSGKKFFHAKGGEVEATVELLTEYERFRSDLTRIVGNLSAKSKPEN